MTTSILDRLGFGQRAKDKAEKDLVEQVRASKKVDKKQLQFDLFTALSYMASLATAKASREVMFIRAAQMSLASSPYFIEINTLVKRLKYDYSEACRAVSDRVTEPEVQALLRRMAGSLNSGEDEAEFLTREANVMAELYVARYERDIESLRKWTDAYSALAVSAGLIVVISIISMMIWSLGPGMILMAGFATCGVVATGTFILHAAAPKEGFTRKAGLTSDTQVVALKLMRYVGGGGLILAALVMLLFGLGPALIIGGLALLPAGYLMNRDHKRLANYDSDIATATRMLGGVTDAIGTTVSDALSKVDRRSLGSLQPYFMSLEVRVRSGISSDRCWNRFIKEVGSELTERTTRIFWDALTIGGNALDTGKNAAFFASTITLLRQKRDLVANMFGVLTIPLHAAMVGLLLFVIEVMEMFAGELSDANAPSLDATGAPVPEIAGASGYNTFANVNFEFLGIIVTIVIIVFTFANAVSPWFASGGHRIRAAYNLGIMMIVSGLAMVIIPPMAQAVFTAISAPAR
jgi:flagellar protein FlaJ